MWFDMRHGFEDGKGIVCVYRANLSNDSIVHTEQIKVRDLILPRTFICSDAKMISRQGHLAAIAELDPRTVSFIMYL